MRLASEDNGDVLCCAFKSTTLKWLEVTNEKLPLTILVSESSPAKKDYQFVWGSTFAMNHLEEFGGK